MMTRYLRQKEYVFATIIHAATKKHSVSFLSNEMGISRPAVQRWSEGVTSPHPILQPRVMTLALELTRSPAE